MKSIASVLLLLLLFTLDSSAQTPSVVTLSPYPKVAFTRNGMFGIHPTTKIVTPDAPDTATMRAVAYLQKRVLERTGSALQRIGASQWNGTDTVIAIGLSGLWQQLDARVQAVRPHVVDTTAYNRGYIIDISPDLIVISAFDPDNLFNATATLSQLVPGSGIVQCAHIWDYPDYPIRWVFSQHNLRGIGAITNLTKILDTMAAYKINGLQQNDFKYNILASQPANYFDSVALLKQRCADRNVQIIPGVCGIGWSGGILWHNPNYAEGFPAKADFVIESDTGRLLPDANINIPNGGFENVDGTGKFTGWGFYDQGVQDKTTYHSGTASVLCENFTQAHPAGNARFMRQVPCKPNAYLYMSAWVKSENFRGTMQLLAIGTDGSTSRQLTFTAFSIPQTSGWIKVECCCNTANCTSVNLYCGVWSGSAGKIWFDDFQVREAGLYNLLRRPGAPLHVMNKRTGTEYIESNDFRPIADSTMINAFGTYGPYHQPPTFRRNPSGALHNGDTVTISYFHPLATVNDNNGDGSVMVCPSEEWLYNELTDQIRRVDGLYQPANYFFGHDEIRSMNRDSSCLHTGKSPAAILSENLTRCNDIVEAQRPGARTFVWSDMFDSLHNAHNNYYLIDGDLTGDWDMIPKQITIVNWNGSNYTKSLQFFKGKGFHQITSPYYDVGNASTIRAWRVAMNGVGNVDGAMYTTWNADYNFLKAFASYFWGFGPYIVHAPLDSAELLQHRNGDSVLIQASVLPDPFNNSDSIRSVTASFRLDGTTTINATLVRGQNNTFSGYLKFPSGTSSSITYRISATSTNATGSTPWYAYTFSTSGVTASHGYRKSLTLHPNPVRDNIVLRFREPVGSGELRITNALGQIIYESHITPTGDLNINVSQYPIGVYRAEFRTVHGTEETSFLIVR